MTRPRWPGGARCVAALSFDVDGISGALNRDPDTARLPTLMSAREYGPSVATPRILELLDRHEIKASFYVPGYVAQTHPALVREIAKRGHEIGHHGYLHEPPATLSREQEAEVLDRGSDAIERVTGERPVGYRSPSWELSENTLELLAERDFLYDSSLMGDDLPYMVDGGSRDLVEAPVHWELDDAPFFSYAPALGMRGLMASPEHVYQVWSAAFEGAHHYGLMFTLTMHPYVIGRPGRLRMLERLIEFIRTFPDVQFARIIDVVSYYKENG